MSIDSTDVERDIAIIDSAANIRRLEEPDAPARTWRDDVPEGAIPAFADPIGREMPEIRIGRDKPFLQLAVEAISIMFWDSETRENWMQENNILRPSILTEEFVERSRVHVGPNATPMPNNPARISLSGIPSENSVYDQVFRDADETYMRALVEVSREMNTGFQQASAVPVEAPDVGRELESSPTLT